MLSHRTSVWTGVMPPPPLAGQAAPGRMNQQMPRRFHNLRRNAAVDSLYCIVNGRRG